MLHIGVLCDEDWLPWNFGNSGFDLIPHDSKICKTLYFFHIWDLNFKSSYHIASLFDIYIDMGERIAGKQNRPSLIIEGPPK